MKAIGYAQSLPIDHPDALLDIELPQPTPSAHDLLVKIDAISVNPVDTKIRRRAEPAPGDHRVLGWDAVGEVIATGESSSLFQPGDKVFYAGDLNRQGCNAEYQLVDERIVGRKPDSLPNEEAAALPLTSITAWEMLFEHLAIRQRRPSQETAEASTDVLLVIGAAGGVGSILVQLAKQLTGATVIATASRDASRDWVKALGADHVIDHSLPLADQVNELGLQVSHIASLTHTDSYFESYIEMLKPFGKIAMIDDPQIPLDVMKLKPKSLSLHIEFMFARSMFASDDMDQQGKLLNRVSELVNQGFLKTTTGKHLGTINANNLRKAHAELESGKTIGKIVLQGFEKD